MKSSKIEDKKHRSKTRSSITKTCKTDHTIGQIAVHNVPLFLMYALGTLIIGLFNLYLAIIFIIYIFISNYLFMLGICAYCPHYGTRSSLCGYGLVTKYITERKPPREFKNKFKRNIGVLFPLWFVPLGIGIFLLLYSFNWIVLILLIIFMVIGFVIVPFGSSSTTCKTCKLRKQCPWMSICGR